MSDRSPIEVDLAKSYRLLNHGPTVLVSSAHGGRQNVMAAAWAMPLDFAPPKMLVIIDKSTLTRELIEASGEFVLNVPSRALAEATLAAGSSSGRDGDKFNATGLTHFPATKVGAPLVEGCLAWLECKVIPEPHNQQTYDMFIGEVVAAHADPRVFQDGHWQFDDEPLNRSIHYIAGGTFFATGEAFEVAKK
ncbi:flavin reductase (DIM6/NTAB) family NADH-FMN oxidoreductase RutF [Silvimonas terrae]|uniref:Flavin reductase (DIM6/NTAB) family NADH-FMN oxidoreductase RutF n=1 Tax=Silvimonas terrae TaxID=300266 RepID=A0A840RIG2_9NEIS|nr:flavin reductase family protein [Silvimonas terrae]MBB5192033.1 flavin reductase (DIM6/NTAB) family NADH-FMN oxidoreductase RutF [Silvimonas terrae]